MALTPSSMLPLGTLAPSFTLLDTVSGMNNSLEQLKSDKATVIMFICNHCPYVKHLNETLVSVANTYIEKGISFIAISSNNVATHPEDSPEKMAEVANKLGYPFPYLYDETQEVAKLYDATCTPDFFVFDANMACVYRGQFDDSRPNSGEANGHDLQAALDAILTNQPVSSEQRPSVGCNIKWKE